MNKKEIILEIIKHLEKEMRRQSMSQDFSSGYKHAIWQIKRLLGI